MFAKLVAADLKLLFRNKQSLFWALAFPVIFATIFGLFNFEQLPDVRVAVFAEDETGASPVITGIRSFESLEITEHEDRSVALQDLADGGLGFVIEIGRDGEVVVHANEVRADTNRIYIPVFRAIVDEVNFRITNTPRVFRVVEETLEGRRIRYYDFVLPGLVAMGVMMYAVIGLAGMIAQFRAQKILRRIRATPLRPRTFVGALVAAHLVLAMIQAAIILVWGVLLFGGTVRGNLLWIALIVALGNIVFLNIGFMISTRSESAQAASGLGNAVTMPMMFFSGVFFPTSTLPWIMPALTSLLPLKPMVDGIRKVALDAASITELGSELGQLALWVLVTGVLATRVFRFERA